MKRLVDIDKLIKIAIPRILKYSAEILFTKTDRYVDGYWKFISKVKKITIKQTFINFNEIKN